MIAGCPLARRNFFIGHIECEVIIGSFSRKIYFFLFLALIYSSPDRIERKMTRFVARGSEKELRRANQEKLQCSEK